MRAPGGALLVQVYAIAARLKMSAAEVLELPEAELGGWNAFFNLERQEHGGR